MSQIKVYHVLVHLDLAQSDTFSSKPIAMLNLVNVSVHRPVMKKCGQYLMSRENAQAGADDAGIKIMRIWILRAYSLFDFLIVVLAPHLLEADNIVVTVSKALRNMINSRIFVFRNNRDSYDEQKLKTI